MITKRCGSVLLLILLSLTGCTLNSSEQPIVTLPVSSNSPQPSVENSPNTSPFSWILPDAEMFGFEGTYGQLYDGIVTYLQVGQEKTRCAIPEVQIWGQDEQAGTYYCTLSFISLYYNELDPLTLDTGVGGGDYIITTQVDTNGLLITDVDELMLDGRYDFTKAQLEKIPGLWEAYTNKNVEPLELYWATPEKNTLVKEYLKKNGYSFTYVKPLVGEKQSFTTWLNTL